MINPPSSNDRLALTPTHTKQSRSPVSQQLKVITAMDQQCVDVSAESQLRAQLEEAGSLRSGRFNYGPRIFQESSLT